MVKDGEDWPRITNNEIEKFSLTFQTRLTVTYLL